MNNSNNLNQFEQFRRACDEAPRGTYEQAKAIRALIGETVDGLIANLKELGLKADRCDGAYRLEGAIYDYLKRSNPDSTVWPVTEGLGKALEGPAAKRVLAQLERERNFLTSARQSAAGAIDDLVTSARQSAAGAIDGLVSGES